MSGIYQVNGHYFTTYAEDPSQTEGYINDYYDRSFAAAKSSSIGKSAGAAAYGWRGTNYPNQETAYFNAVMGKETMFAMYTGETFYSTVQTRPYGHEGVRIATKLPTYGKDPTTGRFLGVGASTTREGKISPTYRMPVAEFRMPWKEIDFAFDYGLGLQALENKDDDVMAKKAYCNQMAVTFSNNIDRTLLRPIACEMPTAYEEGSDAIVETSLNSVYRCIASGKEANGTNVGKNTIYNAAGVPQTSTITEEMVSPFGGGDGDFYKLRKGGANHKKNNLDGQWIDLGGGVISLADIKRLKTACSINWEGKYTNKAFVLSPILGNKISTLMLANNVLINQEYMSKSFNGITLEPGREVGMKVNVFEGIPMVEDANVAFNYADEMPSINEMGDLMLLDYDHYWISLLTPLEMYTNNDPNVMKEYKEHNLMHMRCESRIDKFITSGRITGIQDDA